MDREKESVKESAGGTGGACWSAVDDDHYRSNQGHKSQQQLSVSDTHV